MKRVAVALMVLTAASSAAACAPMMGGPMLGGPPFGRPMYGPPPVQGYQPPSLGRWDEVMSLKSNWVIEVLSADGETHTGRFVRASVRALHFVTSSGPQELPRADVIRVDLIQAQQDGDETAKDVALGAAGGALTVGGAMALIPFLAAGKVIFPPARFWAVGAAAGGLSAVQRNRYDRRPRTIYIAPLGS